MGNRRTVMIGLIAAAALAGCGSTAPARNAAPTPQQVKADLRGSPAPLTSLHAQADHLLGGGLRAFNARLAGLKGYPVVVNKWASWCGPCRSEFPLFEQIAAKLGRRVAFVGINANDGSGQTGAAFLRRFPVTYPSYVDPRSVIAGAIGASTYFPQTLFYSRADHHTYVFDHAGPYESAAALERDITRYALK